MSRRFVSQTLRSAQRRGIAAVRQLGARAYLVIALLFSVLIVGDFGLLGLLSAAETRLFDTLVSHRIVVPRADPDIVIIDIDEASLAAMAGKQGRWPWPNRVLGELVTGLEAQNPQAIVFDILFSDRDVQRAESDLAFNAVIAQSRSTFFPMLRLAPHNDKLSRIPVGALPGVQATDPAADANAPIAIILPKVPAAIDNGRLGTHQVNPDKDGVIRRYPAWIAHAGWRIPSLPQRLAQEFKYPGVDQNEVLLNWRGPPFSYHYVPFFEVYNDLTSAKPQRSSNEFAGKIIVIGSTAPSLFDVKGTPMARIHPGVEILATAIDNFKNGDALRERPAWVMISAALLLIWSMAIALFRQIRIDVFDTVFGVLQVTLVAGAFAVLNLSHWYLDTSAPLSLGLMYFTVVRLYYGVSRQWLANSQALDLSQLAHGTRLLGVLAIRLDNAKPSEKRRITADLDQLVANSTLGAGRITHLIEDPGFVQRVFSDVMLVYWLLEDTQADWEADALQLETALGKMRSQLLRSGRLRFSRRSSTIQWNTPNGWTSTSLDTILSAILGVTNEKSGDRP
jgi:CHASE2 domain-containing sensor protein